MICITKRFTLQLIKIHVENYHLENISSQKLKISLSCFWGPQVCFSQHRDETNNKNSRIKKNSRSLPYFVFICPQLLHKLLTLNNVLKIFIEYSTDLSNTTYPFPPHLPSPPANTLKHAHSLFSRSQRMYNPLPSCPHGKPEVFLHFCLSQQGNH